MAVGGILVKTIGAVSVKKLFAKEKAVRAAAAGIDELVNGALEIERDAKIAAPVQSGRLRASITHGGPIPGSASSVIMRVGTNVEYAPFVEFGTGQRGAGGAGGLVESAKAAMSRMGYKHGSVAGMHSQPFLFPAFEQHRDAIVRRVAEVVRRVMES